jgi:hypothetical protein
MARVRTLGVLFVVLLVGALVGSALAQYFDREPPQEVRAPAPTPIRIDDRVRVEVLNAGGRDGMARAATRILREHGVDVVAFHTAPNFSDRPSVVIDRVGRPDYALAVGELLRIVTVESEPDSTLLLEVTVRIGRDWDPSVTMPPDSVPPRRPWWDFRRYIGSRGSTGQGA